MRRSALFVAAALWALGSMAEVRTTDCGTTAQTLRESTNARAAIDENWFDRDLARKYNSRLGRDYVESDLDAAFAHYAELDFVFLRNPEAEEYLLGLLDSLLEHWHGPVPDFDIVIQSHDAFSASAGLDGFIRLNSGVLRRIESQDELVAILAHELAHILLRHNEVKLGNKIVPWALQNASIINLYVQRDRRGEKSERSERRDLLTGAAVTAIWSDLMAPSRTRAQEQEADRLALDLALCANYGWAAFNNVFERLGEDAWHRDGRLEPFRNLVLVLIEQESRVQSKRNRPSDGDFFQVVRASLAQKGLDAATDAATKLANTLFDGLARLKVEHYKPEQRVEDIFEYFKSHYRPPTKIRPRSTSNGFRAVFGDGTAGGRALAADLAALTVIQAMERQDVAQARSLTSALERVGGWQSPRVDIAAARVAAAEGRAERALAYLASATAADQAPFSAYLEKASLEGEIREYDEAWETLKQGARNIGRLNRFLVPMIHTANNRGAKADAERLTVLCSEVDKEASDSPIWYSMPESLTNLYPRCTEALGFDIDARLDWEIARALQSTTGQ